MLIKSYATFGLMLRLGRRLGLWLRSAEQRLQLRLRLRLPASFVAKTAWTWAWDEYESLQSVASSVCSWNYVYACVCVWVCVDVGGCVWSCVLLSGSLYQGLALAWLGSALLVAATFCFYDLRLLCVHCTVSTLCVCRCVCVCGQGQHEEGRRR